ncbi:MAG: sulfatase-like hydrolase/transferase [Hellea sp.]|nr:sulfatase-like hydrolase/transferase [Hellea sp.]
MTENFWILRPLIIAILIGILAACGQAEKTRQAATVPEPREADPPNIIIIYADDMGFADVGYHNLRADIRTPHIDALAADGAVFTQAYVTSPVCAPSRAGLLLGDYQNKIGFETNLDLKSPDMRRRFKQAGTIAEDLQARGYNTAMAGKWHLPSYGQLEQYGFQYFLQTKGVGPGYTNTAADGTIIPTRPVPEGYHIELGAQFASDHIKRSSEDPFFFYWAPRVPHVPLDAPDQYLARFPGDMPERRRQALAMISAMDDGVGRILETLRETGQDKNTLIFFINDNGAPTRITMPDGGSFKSGWNGSINTPLLGEKNMLTEGGIRVPFIVNWPGRIGPGKWLNDPVMTFDVAATIRAATGQADAPDLPGQNLLPHIDGHNTGAPHEALYWRFEAQSAVRVGDWKLLNFEGRSYLFNLTEDPGETTDLAMQYPDKVAALDQRLKVWTAGLEHDPAKLSDRARTRRREFYAHYLDGKQDINMDLINADLIYGVNPSDIKQEIEENR